MSPRYYLITALLVFGSTLAISVWKQKRTVKEILMVLGQVLVAFVLIIGIVVGFAKLLEILGVAQSGFLL